MDDQCKVSFEKILEIDIDFRAHVQQHWWPWLYSLSGMLPVSAKHMPYLVIYIFVLLIISLFAAITSIAIVFPHYKGELKIILKTMVLPPKLLCLLLWLLGLVYESMHQSYEDVAAIFSDKVKNDSYNIDVRPLKDQSKTIYVGVSFELLAIVDVDEVLQLFNVNGFVTLFWVDEILAWKPENYGGQTMIHPQAKDIWRPRMIVANTLEDRDIFEDDNAPVSVLSDGTTYWYPGSTFPVSCALDILKYPFDEQTCSIELVHMNYDTSEAQFVPLTVEVGTNYFMKNGEWELINSSIYIYNMSHVNHVTNISSLLIIFHISRNPTGILINVIFPVVFLSFLNLWVFVIPVDSGEKISYGTAVLMALSVFMTTMSETLPVSSHELPYIVIYIFILLIISLLTVITTIVIVFLHHKEEKVTQHIRAKLNMKRIVKKVTLARNAVEAMDGVTSQTACKTPPKTPGSASSQSSLSFISRDKEADKRNEGAPPMPNRYKMIGKYIDLVSLIVFTIVWLVVTLAFLLNLKIK